jgi:hypothetical protein
MQLRPDIAGVLIIHARAIKYAEPSSEGDLVLKWGLAWLEYRGKLATTTFTDRGGDLRRDEEVGRCGEATREKSITWAQEQRLFDVVARKATAERSRGFDPCESRQNSARFAALIWRAVTGEPLRSRAQGLFNESTLADSIEGANARDRFFGLEADHSLESDEDIEEEEEQERGR